ncbi:LON peptidase substrate-binding domain-containing protein [Thiobacillus sp.]|uniref:LON peptidase substrate-binding domain-containing protein n=1 Tax=Thiobacillus sp. TaxID=924 RepID=UPI0017EF021F|nr:LON peptidase substrate-binding domain-containing protein [Thiobacillus sp.]MBC2731865.1 peptidase S16 [Thiobacillus sp.]MBC2740603.1 LON peptidase substrate-binding domain-containing protein [Thiobacillus sp.]MBC2758545.1 LON peptidase substrate-binding domain-containing protein [Thiobacillus sp.]
MNAAAKLTSLPLFPLSTVVFPGGRMPLRIFEQRYIDMVKQAIADDSPFGICAIREGKETGTPAIPYSIGTRVRITDWDMPETGILHIDTQADTRFVIRHTQVEPSGLLIGTVDEVSAEPASAIPHDLELAVEILRHIISEYGHAHFPAPHAFDDAVWVSYRLSEVLPLKLSVKQNLLEMNDSVTRMRILTEFLKRQIN